MATLLELDPETLQFMETEVPDGDKRQQIARAIAVTAPKQQMVQAKRLVRQFKLHTLSDLELQANIRMSIDTKLLAAHKAYNGILDLDQLKKVLKKTNAANAYATRTDVLAMNDNTEMQDRLKEYRNAPNRSEAISMASMYHQGMIKSKWIPNANGTYLVVVENGMILQSYKITPKSKKVFFVKSLLARFGRFLASLNG